MARGLYLSRPRFVHIFEKALRLYIYEMKLENFTGAEAIMFCTVGRSGFNEGATLARHLYDLSY